MKGIERTLGQKLFIVTNKARMVHNQMWVATYFSNQLVTVTGIVTTLFYGTFFWKGLRQRFFYPFKYETELK